MKIQSWYKEQFKKEVINVDMYEYSYERKPVKEYGVCEECGYTILEGEEYYDIDNILICVDCIDEYKKIAGEDD